MSNQPQSAESPPRTLRKLIHTPAQYEDELYRQMIYDRWMAEWAAALAAYQGGSPYYGQEGTWRVD
jgi:hypothetical protein